MTCQQFSSQFGRLPRPDLTSSATIARGGGGGGGGGAYGQLCADASTKGRKTYLHIEFYNLKFV